MRKLHSWSSCRLVRRARSTSGELTQHSLRTADSFRLVASLIEFSRTSVAKCASSADRLGKANLPAIRNGARGYFPVSTKASVLKHALPLILLGEFYILACALRLAQDMRCCGPRGWHAVASRRASAKLSSCLRKGSFAAARGSYLSNGALGM